MLAGWNAWGRWFAGGRGSRGSVRGRSLLVAGAVGGSGRCRAGCCFHVVPVSCSSPVRRAGGRCPSVRSGGSACGWVLALLRCSHTRRNPVDDSPQSYTVVFNDEEQYSIWPTGRDLPTGWHAAGVTGTKDDCLTHIGTVWTDMRPLSLRRISE
ncbi:MbtH family protein [Kitasatospora sp. NPDC059795]|uniref:MbtH family protein n=1 Tax=Kitasatospora sp. NPDC059795 TaxID=3346949 RepID=UPI003647986A